MQDTAEFEARVAALEAANRELEIALELSRGEIHQLINLAGHDLQAPLRTVRMFLDLLLTTQDVGLSDKARQYIGHCLAAASHGETLVQGLLTYAHVETGGRDFADAPLGDLAAEALTAVRQSLEAAGGTVVIEALPVRFVDGEQLTDVFRVLLDNAVRYRGSEPPVIRVRAVTRGDGATEFQVIDNGVGIPSRFQDAAFEPFRRVHTGANIDGAGLGLAVAYRIVRRHGGELGVRSEAGAGCTFWFTLAESR